MKNGLLILNAVLLVLVGLLFYWHFSSPTPKTEVVQKTSIPATGFKIAYFEMDSLENHFSLVKEIQSELTRRDEENSRAKMRLKQMYQNKINSYQQKEMSQVQSENATKEVQKLETDIRNQMQSMDQDLQDFSVRKQTEVKAKIESFLKDYNKTKGYSFIFAYEPGFMFYRDTIYNITNDMIKGLNERYGKKK